MSYWHCKLKTPFKSFNISKDSCMLWTYGISHMALLSLLFEPCLLPVVMASAVSIGHSWHAWRRIGACEAANLLAAPSALGATCAGSAAALILQIKTARMIAATSTTVARAMTDQNDQWISVCLGQGKQYWPSFRCFAMHSEHKTPV